MIGTEFTFIHVDIEPDEILHHVVYVCNGDKLAFLQCPCGCREKIVLNLLTESKPCWTIEGNTIKPSIQRTVGCKSHFSITERIVT